MDDVGARMRALRYALLAGVAPVVLLGAAATAQTPGTIPDAQTVRRSAPYTPQLQEITVSVARRTRNLQKVPTAIQVVSGAKIASQGLTNFAQIIADVPSVQGATQPGGVAISIRGLNDDIDPGKSPGAVALELDGVYTSTVIGTALGYFDLENLEVLPGPQSTEYGPDDDGGVVDINTRNPVIGSRAGYATLTVGNYDLVRIEAAQNIPLGDVLAMRVAGTAMYRGSYMTPNSANDVGQAARIKLLYKPDDRFSAKLSYEIDHVGGTGDGFQTGSPPDIGNMVAIYQGDSINKKSNPWNTGPTENGVSFGNSQSHQYENSVALGLNYKINDWVEADELASFTDVVGSGYQCSVDFKEGDFRNPNAPEYCQNNVTYINGNHDTGLGDGVLYGYAPSHNYTSETRLHNPSGSPIDWNFGFYHWSYTFGFHLQSEPVKSEGWVRNTTNAFFGQVAYPITDQLSLVAGARESMDQVSLNPNNNPGETEPDGTINASHFDYTAGVNYNLTPTSFEYAKVTTGYRPPILSYVANYVGSGRSPWVQQPYEVNTAFAVGSKNRLLDDTLQLNAEFFYYIISGYQYGDGYSGYIAETPNGTQFNCAYSVNQGLPVCQLPPMSLKAHTIGLDGQIKYNFTPSDQIGDVFTLENATFDNNQSGCRGVADGLSQFPALAASGACYAGTNNEVTNALQFFKVSGEQQPHAPKISTTITYNHVFNLPSGNLTLGGEVFLTSDYYTHEIENSYTWQPGYMQAGLNADYTPSVGTWEISGYVHNLTDYAVKESGLPVTTLGDPRTFGFNFLYKW